MDDVGRLIVLMAIAGAAFTGLGAAVVWFLDPSRRIRRSLRKILGSEPHALLASPARGKGIGFDFGLGLVAVTWDTGAWCLEYKVDELMGAELIVDDKVAARTHRGEQRRALDQMAPAGDRVSLRFVFDDVTYPDFTVDLWSRQDKPGKASLTAGEAVQEGNRWIARMESLLRRPAPRRGSTLAAEVKPAPVSAPAPPLFAPDDDDDDAEDAA